MRRRRPKPTMTTCAHKRCQLSPCDTPHRAAGRMESRSIGSPRVVAAGLLLFIMSVASGCAHTLTQAEIRYLETRDLHRSFDQTYDASINALFSLGLTIEHSDKSSGIITGQAGDYGHKSLLKKKKKKKYHVRKVTLLVTPRTPALTQIRMKVLVDEEQQLDRKLMTAIWQRIAREALLSDPPPEKTASARHN